MNQISLYHPITNIIPLKSISLHYSLYSLIKDVTLKSVTDEHRSIVDKKLASEFKRTKFPAVTFCGTGSKRGDQYMSTFTDVVAVDIDNLTADQIKESLILLAIIHHMLLAYFISPSGTGIKVLIKVDNYKANPKNIYKAICLFLSEKLSIPLDKFDEACYNLSRLCFLCHDPHIYIHKDLKEDDNLGLIPTIQVDEWLNKLTKRPNSDNIQPVDRNEEVIENVFDYRKSLDFSNKASYYNFKTLVSLTAKKVGLFKHGSRHKFFHLLCSFANQFGIPKESLTPLIYKYFSNHAEVLNAEYPFDLDEEGIKTIDDVYKSYKDQYNTWKPQINEDLETPYIDDAVFKSLPLFFKEVFHGCKNKRQRDVLFLGILGVLSTCWPRIKGLYDNKYHAANLYFFISAPASAGKGELIWAARLGNEFAKRLKWQYLKDLEKYSVEVEEYNASKNTDEPLPKPVPPEPKKFFIPGNASSASMLSCMTNNKHFGIILETEADTLSNTLKQEWGNFSDFLRKAYHHESISLMRRQNKEDLHLETPFLSVVLSGTPDQITKLMNSIENGFFSRFLFYDFPQNAEWHNVFANTGYSLQEFFTKLSKDLWHMSEPFFTDVAEDNANVINFKFTVSQRDRFHAHFKEKLSQLTNVYGGDITASVKRLGVSFFRIAMILSSLRQIQNLGATTFSTKNEFECTDEDYNTATLIISTLLEHTTKIFKQVHRFKKNKFASGTNKEVFLTKLPDSFNRLEAMAIATALDIKEKTAENYLSHFIQNGDLLKPKHNHYEKNVLTDINN